jgi:hypothetical protein
MPDYLAILSNQANNPINFSNSEEAKAFIVQLGLSFQQGAKTHAPFQYTVIKHVAVRTHIIVAIQVLDHKNPANTQYEVACYPKSQYSIEQIDLFIANMLRKTGSDGDIKRYLNSPRNN